MSVLEFVGGVAVVLFCVLLVGAFFIVAVPALLVFGDRLALWANRVCRFRTDK